jgi:DNA-binding CsgD family transcriptional regulator
MDTASNSPAIGDLLARDYAWTTRQRQVLDLIARDRSNAEIAAELGVSLDGAKWHMREILSKLGVDTREEAAEYWRRYNGWQSRFARVFRGLLVTGLFGRTVIVVAAGAAMAAVVVFAVAQWPEGGGDSAPGPGAPLDPDQGAPAILTRADAVLRNAPGYAIAVEASNFELPQWGGSGGGVVKVSGESAAIATLHRIGEANEYEILLRDGTTLFRKVGCTEYLQIPGGTPDVLLPFMLARSSALTKATAASILASNDDVIAVAATLDLVPGRDNPAVLKSVQATIEIARNSGRVLKIQSRLSSGAFAWTFAWDGHIDKPEGAITPVAQQGPGSNECP